MSVNGFLGVTVMQGFLPLADHAQLIPSSSYMTSQSSMATLYVAMHVHSNTANTWSYRTHSHTDCTQIAITTHLHSDNIVSS